MLKLANSVTNTIKARKFRIAFMVGVVCVLLFCGLLAYIIHLISSFYDEYRVEVRFPLLVSVETRSMINIEPRRLYVLADFQEEGNGKIESIISGEGNKDIARYICQKFGLENCKIALAVAKAESGLNCNAVNINKNGTADIGVFQLNTVHLNKNGWSLEKMGGCYSNVDLAYQLWLEQGWGAWVAYTNNSWLSMVE